MPNDNSFQRKISEIQLPEINLIEEEQTET